MSSFRAASAAYESGAVGVTTFNITVPTGVITTDFGMIIVAWVDNSGSPSGQTFSASGWTQRVAGQLAGNMSFAVLTRDSGLVATNTVAVTISGAVGRLITAIGGWWQDVSGVASVSTPVTRASSVTSTVLPPPGSGIVSGETVVCAWAERTNAANTAGVDKGSIRAFYDGTGGASGSSCSVMLSDYVATNTTGETVTATYTQNATTNGGGLQVALTPSQATINAAVTIAGQGSLSATTAAVGAATIAGQLTVAAAGALAPIVLRTMLGIPDGDTIRVTTLTRNIATGVRLAVSTSAGMTSPSFSSSATPDSDGYCTNLSVAGLTAGTAYWYQLELDGTLVGTPVKTGTLSSSKPSFSVMFGSCTYGLGNTAGGRDSEAFAAGLARTNAAGGTGPDAFIDLGDVHYRYSSTSPDGTAAPNSVSTFLSNYETNMQQPMRKALYAGVPSTHMARLGPLHC